MLFTSYWFLLLSLVFLPLYWAVRVAKLRLIGLILTGGCFYAHFAGVSGLLVILLLAFTTYVTALSTRPWLHWLGMAFPLLALIFFKYTHFVSHSLLGLVSPGLGESLDKYASDWLPLSAPLAISFFSFEFIHYVHDVHTGSKPIRDPLRFCAFAFFFPTLVSGPIKRYQPFLSSLESGLCKVSLDDIKVGAFKVLLGFFKKVVIADNLSVAIRFWQEQYETLPIQGRWLFLLALSLRVLMDFSGYSDIAIGLARMMGIRIAENFNWPYLATSLREYWRRWHISLSSWIRDYVYIPLGGNRHGRPRTVLNALIAFSLCGLWHGADWHFLFWGFYNGVGLVICGHYRSVLGAGGRWVGARMDQLPILGWLLTLGFVFIGRFYFYYPIPEATRMISLLFLNHG